MHQHPVARFWDRYRATNACAPSDQPVTEHFCDNETDAAKDPAPTPGDAAAAQAIGPQVPGVKKAGVLYGPDFVVNAGGLIRLAGLYIGLTEAQINQKIDHIEQTTTAVLKEANSLPSAYEAAVSYAKRRIELGRTNRKTATAAAR